MAAALRLVRAQQGGLKGLYNDWESARRNGDSYDTITIQGAVVTAAEKASRSNGRLFDRDGHVFDVPITPFPLLACLLKLAGWNGNRLNVIDFGGALGATYRQCKPFMTQLSLRWVVVEQAAIVKIGTDRFQDEVLRFAEDMAQAANQWRPDVLIFSGVLQYLDDPYDVLKQALALNPAMIIVDRNPFSSRAEDIFTVQHVPRYPFSARLPFRIFGHDVIEKMVAPGYGKFAQFDTVDPDMRASMVAVRFLGKVFERVEGSVSVPILTVGSRR
ncbi:MAG: methyltransferase, TIGR04325 family [Hyphomonadaceae bacterium]|jgi:putative methyltransferase (TIGR04325 family)|nr:methyltransferase, TIGR04325 family [Hyphomonadaceae bacterium]